MFDYQKNDAFAEHPFAGQEWLRRILGDEYFREITAVRWNRVANPAASTFIPQRDEDLAILENCDRLEELQLSASAITDAGFEHLKRLTGDSTTLPRR